ncbi:MAG TPA: sigma-70 family RNA polymerase sigma factor [Anaerolineales bacterium]|nr:sigma-70 family RNA polymerase sigma factor [Anaerolineales bacterium]
MLQSFSRWFQGVKQDVPLVNPEAFSQLYELNYRSVFRYLFGLHGGPLEDIEDLTAETFIHAWRARHTFSGDTPNNATAWLLRIARRLVIDNYRREQARIQTEEELADDLPQLGPTPENLVQIGEQYETLWRLLQRLPGRQREMLVLRYFLDWRVTQIGEYMALPENTVSVTIRRGLARLQQEWPADKEI